MTSATRIPTIGLYRNPKHQYFFNGAGPFPGVTSVIRVIDKPAIVGWAKRETARCAVENLDMVTDLIAKGGPKAAASWLAQIPDYQRDTAADLGSAVHRLAEETSRGEQVSVTEEQAPFVAAYHRFLNDYSPEFKSLERMVFSEAHGYGGTFDWLAVIDGKLTLGDTKTSKAVYPETALQLAALGNADFIGLTDDERKYTMPRIEQYAVLHLRPEQYASGYRLIEFHHIPEAFEAFLAALRLTNYKLGPSPIGESLPLPVREAA